MSDEEKKMKLYHTGTDEIRVPDIFRGRKNADFGQGFYLTPDREFTTEKAAKQLRWVRSEKIMRLDPRLRRAEQEEYGKALEKVILEIVGE